MGKFYPPFGRMFEEVKSGRKLAYTPEQLVEEFEKYIHSLSDDEMEVETEFRRMRRKGKDESGGTDAKDIQLRKAKFHRAPKITDFVVRWLGKSMSWWNLLDDGKRGKQFFNIKNIITQYCYDVKLDGAVAGIYNPSIIARDIGLKDTIRVEKHNTDKDMSLDEVNAEIERLQRFR